MFLHAGIGLLLLLAVGPVLALLMALSGRPSPFGPAWFWVVELVLQLGGSVLLIRLSARDRVLRRIQREDAIEVAAVGRGARVQARCAAADFAVRLCPIRVQVLSRPVGIYWKGFALVASVEDQSMLLACNRSGPELERQIDRAPGWLRTAFVGEGPAIKGVGTVRVSEVARCRGGL